MSEETTIFYSWQSDLPNAVNRGLIQTALEKAAKTIRNDESISVLPVIERDTQNVPGSPQIADTIFEKIAAADVLVADVSFIVNGKARKDRRPCPNPNVLVELGFAVHALGWERIILVMNTNYGAVEKLPFDLRMRRTLAYSANPKDAEKAPSRRDLERRLEAALREILEQPKPTTTPSLLNAAVGAVRAGAADQAATAKDFMSGLVARLDPLDQTKPPTINDFDEAIMGSLAASVPLVSDFGQLVDAIGRHGSREAALGVVASFGQVRERYEHRSRQGGSFYKTDFDFFKVVGHEMFTMLVAAMMRHDRWEILAELLDQPLVTNTSSGRATHSFTALSEYVKTLEARNTRLELRRVCLHGDVLKERHEAEPLASTAPFSEVLEADWLLFLRTDLPPERGDRSTWFDIWRPWSCIYAGSHGVPTFLLSMERRRFAERVLPCLGFTNPDEFRERYRERAKNLGEVFGGRGGFIRTPTVDANRIASI